MNVLITGATHYTADFINSIEKQGWNVDIHPQEADIVNAPEKYEAVVCNNLFATIPIENFKNLKFIQLTSAGIDRMPLDFINSKGIILKNAHGVYSIPMAEWVLASILDVYKDLEGFKVNQRKKEWVKNRNLKELNNKKAAIIGAGNIGGEIAKRLSVFGVEIIGFDIAINTHPLFNSVKHITDFDSAFFDIVILTAPHTKNTHHLIDRKTLISMPEGALLINVSRGGLLDQQACLEVLKERADLTAILDVFENEPLSYESELWDLKNLRISPHNSFVGEYNDQRLHKVIISNLNQFLKESD